MKAMLAMEMPENCLECPCCSWAQFVAQYGCAAILIAGGDEYA